MHESSFVDLGSVFGLLQIRGGAPGGNGKGGGVDYLAGYNVHTIAIQDQNDKPFLTRFPYVAASWGGSSGGALHGKPAGKM